MTAENSYRQHSYQTASSIGMVITLFDFAIEALDRALAAVEAGDIETRTNEVGRAITALGELQSGLDFSKGGEVARRMDRFYSLVRGQLLEGQIKCSKPHFVQMQKLLVMVRDAWKEGEQIMQRPTLSEFPAPSVSAAILNSAPVIESTVRWSA